MRVTNDPTILTVPGTTATAANLKVAAWIMTGFRAKNPHDHLASCAGAEVTFELYDGEYGCDTGCEYYRLESVVSCPHGNRVDHDYGNFGQLADYIEELEP